MGTAAGLTFWLVATVTGRWTIAFAAVILETVLQARLYSYPKLLVPVLVLCVLYAYVRQPSAARLGLLGAATAFGLLLRNDLGVFAFIGVVAGLIATHRGERAALGRRLEGYAIALFILLLPYALFLQQYDGVVEQFRESIEFSKSDAHQFLMPWSKWPSLAGLTSADAHAAAVLRSTSYALVALGAACLVWRWSAIARPTRAVLTAAIVVLACYDVWIIRHPIAARLPDAAALLVIVGAWVATEFVHGIDGRCSRRWIAATIAAAVLVPATVAVTVSVFTLGRIGAAVEQTRVSDGIGKVLERVAALKTAGTRWPWSWYLPDGDMRGVVHYLNGCTAQTDRVLLTWSAPEYFFFARRGFAAGHVLLMPPRSFATPADQLKMIHRLERERVPIALINESARDQFAGAFPAIDAYVRRWYVPSGAFTLRDGSEITVAVRRELRPHLRFGSSQWPCGFS
jgi:hypothetical protein